MSHDNVNQCPCESCEKRRDERYKRLHKPKVYKGKITFNDKTYDCEVKDGVRYIDGKTVDEFLKTIQPDFTPLLIKKGVETLTGKKPTKN